MIVGYNQAYADLVRFAGTQMQELRVNLEASAESREFYGYLSVREGIVYISGGRSGQSDEYGVYTYGNYFPWTSKSLVLNYALSTNRFTFHAHSEVYSYFACVDNKVYKIEHNNPPTSFADSGYVVSEVHNGAIWEELSLEDLRIAFETNGGTIKIYVRTSFDVWASFLLIKEITSADYGTKKYCKVNRNEWLSTVSLGSQEEYQFKIELIRWATTTSTPVVKRFTAFIKTDGR